MLRKPLPIMSILLTLALLVLAVVPALAAPPDQAEQTIIDVAMANGNFSTLLAAVKVAGLTETLQSEGPFTLFAPTNEAFNKLPAGMITELLNDSPALTDLLLYHVVPGEVNAAEVITLDSVSTVLGQPVTIRFEEDQIFINDAQVIITDIEASNGVIHVIDTVIVPPVSSQPAAMPASGAETNRLALLLAWGLLLLAAGAGIRLRGWLTT